MMHNYLAEQNRCLYDAVRKLQQIYDILDFIKNCEPTDYESIIGGLRYSVRRCKLYLKEYTLLMSEQQKQVDNWFQFHPVINDQAERYEAICNVAGKRLAKALLLRNTQEVSDAIDNMEQTINQCCPDSVEKEYALEHLDKLYKLYMQGCEGFAITVLRFSVIMPANAAIACNEHEVSGLEIDM